jgi:hypothetical protein
MTKFDPSKDHSQIVGDTRRKWIQDGRYFDKNFEPLDEKDVGDPMPPVHRITDTVKVKPVPIVEGVKKERVVGKKELEDSKAKLAKKPRITG